MPDAGTASLSGIPARGADARRRRNRRPAHRSARLVLAHPARPGPMSDSGRPASDGRRSRTLRSLRTVLKSLQIGSLDIAHRPVHHWSGGPLSQCKLLQAAASARASDNAIGASAAHVDGAVVSLRRRAPCRSSREQRWTAACAIVSATLQTRWTDPRSTIDRQQPEPFLGACPLGRDGQPPVGSPLRWLRQMLRAQVRR